MDLDGARLAVERASVGLAHPAHRAASEQTLIEFRRSPHALPACRHILRTSGVVEACFQASTTLRDAALRDWAALPPEERAGLRQFCLSVLLGSNDNANAAAAPASTMPVVTSQLISVLAVMIKRAWLDVDETSLGTGATQSDYQRVALRVHEHRSRMLAEAEQAVSMSNTPHARVVGLNLFSAVITEFAPSTASPMHLPWDFHERCRVSLQNDFLSAFFSHGVGLAKTAAQTAFAPQGTDDGICVASLRLINTALSWDFQFTGQHGGGFGFGLSDKSAKGENSRASDGLSCDAVKIAPGVGWRDALLLPGAIDWVFTLYASGREAGAASRQSGVASGNTRIKNITSVTANARTAVSNMCALAGDVFPNKTEDPTEQTRRAHFGKCASSLSNALTPARQVVANACAGVGDAEETMADGARSIAALSAIHAPGIFFETSSSSFADTGASPTPLASTLGELTVALLDAGALLLENEGGALDEALRSCMEAWANLAERSRAGQEVGTFVGGGGAVDTDCPFPGQVETSRACAAVFETYLRAGLVAAASAAHEEDDGQEEEGKAGAAALDERLSLAARVGRAAPEESLALLCAAMEGKKNALAQALATQNVDPSETLEELWWLARLTPHVLCDPFEGEFPLPPESIAECTRRWTVNFGDGGNASGQKSPVETASTSYLNVVLLCLDENALAQGAVSPRLIETLCWGASRWVDTYLMPEDVGGSAHASVFGANRPSLSALGLVGDGESRVRGGIAKLANPSPFSEEGGGVHAVDALLKVALVALTRFPGEQSAQRVAAKMLLPALTRRRALCRACGSLESWRSLMECASGALGGMSGGFGNQSVPGSIPTSPTFPPEIHRLVTEAVCRAAEGLAGEQQCQEYITRALFAAGAGLRQIATNPDAVKHPTGELFAVCVLEALRGAARASAARSQAAVFAFFKEHFVSLLVLQSAGVVSAQVSRLSLKLTEEFVEAQACFLAPSNASVLCGHCMKVIETYRVSGRGVLGDHGTTQQQQQQGSLRKERSREAYKEVKALLRMLTHVSSVDADVTASSSLDSGPNSEKLSEAAERGGSMRGGSSRGGGAFAGVFGPGGAGIAGMGGGIGGMGGGVAAGGNGDGVAFSLAQLQQNPNAEPIDVPTVVLLGLDLVLPLLTEELLTFPKLCHQYFTLLAHMLEAYPRKVVNLHPQTFKTLMRTLEFGVTHLDLEIGAESFAALAGLATFHHREVGKHGHGAGLGAHNAPGTGDGDTSGGVLSHLMKVSINRLLFEDASAALAEPAADALLPLMLCEQLAFSQVADELLQGLASDTRAHAAVTAALRNLTTGGGLTDRVDRANKRRFRRNVNAFVLDVRAFVRKN